jgi:hypothetical protein
MKARTPHIYFLIVVFSSVVTCIDAQSLIARSGMSFATTSGNIEDFGDVEIKYISGYYAGIAYLHPLGKAKTSLQAEILWINKGQNI